MILQKENKTQQTISQGGKLGLLSRIDIVNSGRVEDIYVGVDIRHDSIEDLKVKLISPSGRELLLHGNTAEAMNKTVNEGVVQVASSTATRSAAGLKVKYNREVLEAFIGEKAAGCWQLKINNKDPEIDGTLNSWVIGMSCSNTEGQTSSIYLKDNASTGLESKQYCQIAGQVTGIELDLFVQHPFVGDLTVDLISPLGMKSRVYNRKGGDRKNLRATFNKATLRNMIGEQALGEWKLVIKDHSAEDKGRLRNWTLNLDILNNDDFTKIEGVGDMTQELLYNSGINTYSKLASIKNLEILLEESGFRNHNASTWRRQAHMAAIGEWTALKSWQYKLKGGVEVQNQQPSADSGEI